MQVLTELRHELDARYTALLVRKPGRPAGLRVRPFGPFFLLIAALQQLLTVVSRALAQKTPQTSSHGRGRGRGSSSYHRTIVRLVIATADSTYGSVSDPGPRNFSESSLEVVVWWGWRRCHFHTKWPLVSVKKHLFSWRSGKNAVCSLTVPRGKLRAELQRGAGGV